MIGGPANPGGRCSLRPGRARIAVIGVCDTEPNRTRAETQVVKRVVLAYSGGLDTSVAVRWMIEEMGVEVITLAADVGQGGDFETIRQRALAAGAIEALVVDCTDRK